MITSEITVEQLKNLFPAEDDLIRQPALTAHDGRCSSSSSALVGYLL